MTLPTRRTCLALVAAAALAGGATAQTLCTQSVDNTTITVPWATGCVWGGPIGSASNRIAGATGWLRRYSPSTDCMTPNGVSIGAMRFGVQEATSGPASNGVLPLDLRLYKLDPALPLKFVNMTLLHDERILVPDQAVTWVVHELSAPVFVPAGYDVVAELWSQDGFWTQDIFRPATNGLGETAPTYTYGSCFPADPITAMAAGAVGGNPNMQVVLDLEVTPGIGARYCAPAVANSTGAPATLNVTGSRSVADNDLTLHAQDLPANSFAFFLVSQDQGFAPGVGGSQGALCLGGSIGRYVGPGQVQQVVAGAIALSLDLTQTPTPAGLVGVAAGETWSFQCWYRDSVAGMPASNFSDALRVSFH